MKSAAPLVRGRFLYAEDSIPNQKIVKRMLERAGALCTVVENGEAAVYAALHAAPPFDCILMVWRYSVRIDHRFTPG